MRCGRAPRRARKRGKELIEIKYDFDEPVDRHGTWSCEWDATDEYLQAWDMGEKMPENAICLSTADMDFHCAPCIKDALGRIVDFNLYGYCTADPTIAKDYVEAVAGWYKKRYHWTIQPGSIQYTNGTVEALRIAVKALTRRGDGILITPPVYYPFMDVIAETERVRVTSHLINKDMYYTIDWEDFEKKAADAGTKLCIFCSPHNPSGRVWTEDELRRVYEICTRNHVILVVDELHGDLTRKDVTFRSIGSLVEGENLVICSGANKSFNIAALQASHMITTNPAYQKKLSVFSSPSPFTLAAVIAAYTQGEDWLDQLREYLDGNLDFAVDFLGKHMPKVKVRKPEGSYILWMDFRDYSLTDEEIHRRIMDRAGVIYEDGLLFDPEEGTGFVRLCLGTQRAVLREALERISKQFEK